MSEVLKRRIDAFFEGKRPWRISLETLVLLLAVFFGRKLAIRIRRDGVKRTTTGLLFKFLLATPGVKDRVHQELEKAKDGLRKSILADTDEHEPQFQVLPKNPVPQPQLLELLQRWSETETARWKQGQVSGSVYHGGSVLMRFLSRAYAYFAVSNPLHPETFPYVRKMESEVISMSVNLFNGDENCCGAITSGGTESILMAMKAYRDKYRVEKGILYPNIVCPVSAHAAFDKAAQYFGIELRHVPVDQETFQVDPRVVEAHMDRNTIAIMGSAPHYPQGIIDPIEELAALAQRKDVGMHVDCCLGGFLLPFVEKIGHKLPLYDFRVPGVTSISADTHKYGYAPKGTSVVMFNSGSLRRYMYFVCPEWTGGIYATPCVSGSRPGGLIAATWAALVAIGEQGYVECARRIMQTSQAIKHGIQREVEGLKVLGDPLLSVIAFTNDPSSRKGKDLNIYKVSEAMQKIGGWHLNTLQRPASIHICCTHVHRQVAGKFIQDLKAAVHAVLEHPEQFKGGSVQIYGATETLSDDASGVIVKEMAATFIDTILDPAPMNASPKPIPSSSVSGESEGKHEAAVRNVQLSGEENENDIPDSPAVVVGEEEVE